MSSGNDSKYIHLAIAIILGLVSIIGAIVQYNQSKSSTSFAGNSKNELGYVYIDSTLHSDTPDSVSFYQSSREDSINSKHTYSVDSFFHTIAMDRNYWIKPFYQNNFYPRIYFKCIDSTSFRYEVITSLMPRKTMWLEKNYNVIFQTKSEFRQDTSNLNDRSRNLLNNGF